MANPNIKWEQAQWLLSKGVSPSAIFHPTPIMTCRGKRAQDGRFDEDPEGPYWLAFLEEYDRVFWQPRTREAATEIGRSFALGEEQIGNVATTAFNRYLNIYADPLQWLQNERHGIVVLRWQFAFDRLRDVPRVAISSSLLTTYNRMMKPLHMPKLAVLPNGQRTAP